MAEIANNLANVIALNNDVQQYNPSKRNPLAADRQQFRDDSYDKDINNERSQISEKSPRNNSDDSSSVNKEDFRKVLEKRLSEHQKTENEDGNSKKDQKSQSRITDQNELSVFFFEKPQTKEQIITRLAQKADKKLPQKENSNILQNKAGNKIHPDVAKTSKPDTTDKMPSNNELIKGKDKSEFNTKESRNTDTSESFKRIHKSVMNENKKDPVSDSTPKQADTKIVDTGQKNVNSDSAAINLQKNNVKQSEIIIEKPKTAPQTLDNKLNSDQSDNLNNIKINPKNRNNRLDVKLDNKPQEKTDNKVEINTDDRKEKNKKSLNEIKSENAQEKIQADQILSETKITNNTPEPVISTSKSSGPMNISAVDAAAGISGTRIQRPAAQIVENIQALINGPEREITMTLNPAELGRVRIRFAHQQGQVSGILEIEKPQTRQEIERQLPEIVAAIQNNGVQVRKIEVVQQQQQQSQQNNHSDEDIPYKFNPDTEHPGNGQGSGKKGNNSKTFKQDIDEYTPASRVKTTVQTLSDNEINVYL